MIGERIREYRKLRGMSQQELADRLGLGSRERISQWERSARRVDANMVWRIARALGVKGSQLIKRGGVRVDD